MIVNHSMKAYFFIIIFILTTAIGQATVTDLETSNVILKLKTFQKRVRLIALNLDSLRCTDMIQAYPSFRECRDSFYNRMIYNSTFYRGPDITKAIVDSPLEWPWQLIVLGTSDNEDTRAIRRVQSNTSVFRDPFSANGRLAYYPGYPSNDLCNGSGVGDYIIVSIGPDRKNDILPLFDGITTCGCSGYAIGEFMKYRRRTPEFREYLPTETPKEYDRFIDAIYDPTNGIVSSGDIVFHRNFGTDSLFWFDADVMLSSSTIALKLISVPK